MSNPKRMANLRKRYLGPKAHGRTHEMRVLNAEAATRFGGLFMCRACSFVAQTQPVATWHEQVFRGVFANVYSVKEPRRGPIVRKVS